MLRKRMIWQALALAALAAATAMCGKDDLEEESQEVIDAQQEAAEVAEERPGDTAAIREAGKEVEQEQREAAQKMREELRDKGLDTLRTTTRQ